MEELTLTTPEVVPEKVTAKYRVVSLTLNTDALEVAATPPGMPAVKPGLIVINLRNEHDEPSTYTYTGDPAMTMIKTLNTANLTTKSMHKRVLEQLSKDGKLPGTVTGTPDP